MPGEQYVIEFVGDPDRFAPAATKVIGDMRNIEKVSRDINARAREQVAIDNQRGALAQKRKADAFQELAAQQKIALLEERRLRIAQALAIAQARGQSGRALLLGQGMRGIDSGLTLMGAGGFTPFRNGFRRMKPANVIDVQDVSGNGGGVGRGTGGTKSEGGGSEAPNAPVPAAAGGSMKSMLKGMAVFGGLMHVIRQTLMLPGAAREMSPSAQAREEDIRKLYQWSQGAIAGMSQLANAFTTLVEVIKKGIGETVGTLTQVNKMYTGIGLSGLGMLGNKKFAAWGQDLQVDATMNLPKWMGGLGGSDAEDVIARNKSKYATRLAEKRKEYVDKMLDAAKARIDADREKYNEGVRHRKQQRFEDRKFVYGGDLGGLVGASSSGLYAAGAGAAVAGQMVSIQKQTLDALKQNVAATRQITPAINKLATGPFVYPTY